MFINKESCDVCVYSATKRGSRAIERQRSRTVDSNRTVEQQLKAFLKVPQELSNLFGELLYFSGGSCKSLGKSPSVMVSLSNHDGKSSTY